MNKPITVDSFNRLSMALMEKYGDDHVQALTRLESLRLVLACNGDIAGNVSLQAALVTAVNTGKRAFLGGVFVQLPVDDIPYLLPHPTKTNLAEVVRELGGKVCQQPLMDSLTYKLTFGFSADIAGCSMQVVCNSWQGGVCPCLKEIKLDRHDYLPLGGIAAGAIAVGIAFLVVSGIDSRCGDLPTGISLWRPDLSWLDERGGGKKISELPAKVWLLGLGHLGQAYIWNLAHLPYKNVDSISFLLQDFDRVIEANQSAGVLSEETNINWLKTRMCSQWLEARGFKTTITERKFDGNTKVIDGEPYVALCGFDNSEARSYLENAGFDLIIEAALGGSLQLFDDIVIHTFPTPTVKARDLWDRHDDQVIINEAVLAKLTGKDFEPEKCGRVPLAIAGKAISSSFTGVLAGAIVVAELVRSANCEKRYEQINTQVRNMKYTKAFPMGEYMGEIARNGTVSSAANQ